MLPEQGWNGDKPSTISGVFLLWGTRVIRFAPLLRRPMPVIPVDVVAAGDRVFARVGQVFLRDAVEEAVRDGDGFVEIG